MDQIIAANYLLSLEKCLDSLGVQHFFKTIDFDEHRFHDPDAFVSHDEFVEIISKAYELSGCAHLGLLFGRSLSIVTNGFLGYAAMCSPTLGIALQTMIKYITTRTNMLIFRINEGKDGLSEVEFSCHFKQEEVNRFFTEMVVAHLDNMRRFLANIDTPLPKIEISYPEPAYGALYHELLQTDILFDTGHNCTWVLSSDLSLPINFADNASFHLARSQLEALADKLANTDDFPGRIKALLMKEDSSLMGMDQVARLMFMSSRTLRRHLHKHQITYQDILDEVRRQKAETFLQDKTLSITEISFALGFHDISNFSKAFKRWTGFSPSDYRDKF